MTTPTPNPVPSNNLLDAKFNFEKLDEIINSDGSYYVDRMGKTRLTTKGMEEIINAAAQGYSVGMGNADGWKFMGKVLSFSDLKSLKPGMDGQRILLNGYYAGSSLGGGEFVSRLGTKADDGGTIAAGDGYYWERVDKTSLTVLDFGAIGDATTSDVSAFNSAWAAKVGTVHIPAGRQFVIDSKVGSLTVSNPTKWTGEGDRSVILVKPGGGFDVTGLSWGFEKIRFVPVGVVDYAIKTGVVDNNRGCSVKECIFKGYALGNYFNICGDFTNIWYFNIYNNLINQSGGSDFGKSSPYGIGFQFKYSVNGKVTHNDIGSCDKGIYITGDAAPNGGNGCEGILIKENIILANITNVLVENGYYINVSDNVIDIPLSVDSSGNNIGNPLVFRGMCGVVANNWIAVAASTIVLGKGIGTTTAYDGSCNIFTNNIVRGTSGKTNDLVTADSALNLFEITGNQFTFGGRAINATGNCAQWIISNNTFSAQSIACYDVSKVSRVKYGNNRGYHPTLTPSKVVASDAVGIPVTFNKTTSQPLPATNAGVSVTFTVDVPAGYFSQVPEVAFAQLATGSTNGTIRYVKGESTATLLKFSYISINDAINAGNYSFSIMAVDNNSTI